MTISEHKLNTEQLTRLPRHDLVVEEMIIASLIKFESIRGKVSQIEPDDFYSKDNRHHFIDIKNLVDSSNIDFDIKATNFKTELLLAYTHQPDVMITKFDYYFKRFKQLSNFRKLEKIAYDIEKSCQEDRDDIEIRNTYLQKLNDIKPYDLKDIIPISKVVKEKYDNILNFNWREHILTGFEPLDNVIGGFRKKSFYAIGGVTSVGKTTFMLNIVRNIAEAGKHILFLQLEMPDDEVVNRIVSNLMEISTGRLTGFNFRKDISDSEKESLKTARDFVESYDINFVDHSSPCVRDIADRIEILGNVDIVFIDYLQRIRATSGKNPYEKVTQTSRDLKSLAMKYDLPVVVIASINRANIARPNKKPQLSDFRDSGNVEYDLDCAMLLHRPSQFNSDTDENYSELNLAKNRYGKSNIKFEMEFIPEQSKFINMKIKEEL